MWDSEVKECYGIWVNVSSGGVYNKNEPLEDRVRFA